MDSYSYGIDFLTDSVLEDAVDKLLAQVKTAQTEHDPYKNVIDPFAAIFEAASIQLPIHDWLPSEVARQQNKSLTNAIGDFQQDLIGRLPGWISTGKSGGVVDLKHPTPFGVNQKPALAEVKNKYNTMNSTAATAVYDIFQNQLKWPETKDHNFYLIQVIQRKPSGDIPWKPSGRGINDRIRRIGATQVYAESTGQDNAFRKLFDATLNILSKKHGFIDGRPGELSGTELFRRAFNF